MFNFLTPEYVPYAQIVLAFLLGLALGIEREYVGKAAGMRTYSLISVGAALFTIISKSGFQEFMVDFSRYDPSRIASNIVVGIGFLGAGVIVLRGAKVEGLTTAAGMWVSAGIGMAVGVELYELATFTAILAFFILSILNRIDVDAWLLKRIKKQ